MVRFFLISAPALAVAAALAIAGAPALAQTEPHPNYTQLPGANAGASSSTLSVAAPTGTMITNPGSSEHSNQPGIGDTPSTAGNTGNATTIMAKTFPDPVSH
jgi:hypothetical protein